MGTAGFVMRPGVIRSGDYPKERVFLDVTILLSELIDVARVRNYFAKAIALMANLKKRQESLIHAQQAIDLTIRDIPSLL